jgi:hypothetical protein
MAPPRPGPCGGCGPGVRRGGLPIWLGLVALVALATAAVRQAEPPGSARPGPPVAPRGETAPPAGRPAPDTGPGPLALYRWVDGQGVVHLESSPPGAGTFAEVIPLPPPAQGASPAAAPRQPDGSSIDQHPLSVYTPEGLRALAGRVDDTRRALGARDRQLEALQRELSP